VVLQRLFLTIKNILLPKAKCHRKGQELLGKPSDDDSVFRTLEIPTFGSGEGLNFFVRNNKKAMQQNKIHIMQSFSD